jgi:hypothetical protein
VPFTCEEFQVFHFGVIGKFLFIYLSFQVLSFSFHCIFKKKLLNTLRSYGVKASEHE